MKIEFKEYFPYRICTIRESDNTLYVGLLHISLPTNKFKPLLLTNSSGYTLHKHLQAQN